MAKFSANLGFLWADLPLPDAILAAAAAGFDAVECHWPYAHDMDDVRNALAETGLKMLGINTLRGKEGDFGLSALPGREDEARAAIEQAVEYATGISASGIHVMAGIASGPEAEAVFLGNVAHACDLAEKADITLLLEPMNAFDAPGYFLPDPATSIELIGRLNRPNLKLMFDCYHVARMGLEVMKELKTAMPHIGHIQFAAVPDRSEPDHGTVDYRTVFGFLDAIGYDRPLGAEYRPSGGVEAGLGWLKQANSE